MKKFKFNYLAIIGMMVAMATVAFTAPKAATVSWVFMGEELSEVANITAQNYHLEPIDIPENCGAGNELPCEFEVDESINTISKLETYLTTSFGSTPEDIRDGATTKKSEE